MLALEIHDAGIVVGAESGRLAGPSPGYAVIDGETVITGAAAWEVARLKPRHVNNRFWSELDTEPLPHPFPGGVTHADLAHAHLAQVWSDVGRESTEVLLAVPSTLSEPQLGLLLGIARAAGLAVRGLVDGALAAAATVRAGGTLVHVDLQLHGAVSTVLRSEDDVVRARVEVEPRAGLVAIQDAWTRRVAELFVRQTRFDPFHRAETEQALYRQLPGWVEELHRQPETEVAMAAGGRDYPLRLTRAQIVAAAADGYERVVRLAQQAAPTGGDAVLVLSHRVAALPGLPERLARLTAREPLRLAADAACRGALAACRHIRAGDDSVPFVTRLPRGTGPDAGPAPAAEVEPAADDRGGVPTHLVHAGRAYPIGHDPLVIGVAVENGPRGVRIDPGAAGISRRHCSVLREGRRVVVDDHSTYGTLLNGKRVVRRAELRAGDRLRLGQPGIEVQLVALVGDDGPT